jgi:hypothetical protein
MADHAASAHVGLEPLAPTHVRYIKLGSRQHQPWSTQSWRWLLYYIR